MKHKTKQTITETTLSIMMWTGLIITGLSIAYWTLWITPTINLTITGGTITQITTQGGIITGLILITITSLLGKLYGRPTPKT